MPLQPSDFQYSKTQRHVTEQSTDIGFAARVPPIAGLNVAFVGDVVVHGSALFSRLLSRDAVNVTSGNRWFRQSDNQAFMGLLATLLWCARNDPEYFVRAMGLDPRIRTVFALEIGGAAQLDTYFSELQQSGYDQAVARTLYAENWSSGRRLWLALSDASFVGVGEGIGFLTSAIFVDDVERQAMRDLMGAMSDDPQGFVAAVGQQIYDDLMLDIEPGDHASAVGCLSGTAVDVFLGAKGLTRAVDGIRTAAFRNVGEVGVPNRTVDFGATQIRKKYKHTGNPGVDGNYNAANVNLFEEALSNHVQSSSVRPITGTYRGQPVTHYVDPSTGLNVMQGPDGVFVSGWLLNPTQLQKFLQNGSL